MARTALSVSEYAVMRMTTAFGSIAKIRSNHSNPSCPLTASRLKFMSSKTTSGWKVRMKCSMRAGCVVTFILAI